MVVMDWRNPSAESWTAPRDPLIPTVLGKLQKWGDYDSCGTALAPSRFIPMKTPMSRAILENWTVSDAPKHRFTVFDMLQRHQQLGQTVGLIIDLTNHNCLYSDDIPPLLQYRHINLVAKQLPSAENVAEVMRTAREFWSQHPNLYIAIHCSYGFNRTGFVTCCCLIEMFGMHPNDAIKTFAAARAPGIKHEKFMAELRLRYGAPPCIRQLSLPRSCSLQLGSAPADSHCTAVDAANHEAPLRWHHSAPAGQTSSSTAAAQIADLRAPGRSSSQTTADLSPYCQPSVDPKTDVQPTKSCSLGPPWSCSQINTESCAAVRQPPTGSPSAFGPASMEKAPMDCREGSSPTRQRMSDSGSGLRMTDSDHEETNEMANQDSIGSLMSDALLSATNRQRLHSQGSRTPGLLELSQGCWPPPQPAGWQQTVTST